MPLRFRPFRDVPVAGPNIGFGFGREVRIHRGYRPSLEFRRGNRIVSSDSCSNSFSGNPFPDDEIFVPKFREPESVVIRFKRVVRTLQDLSKQLDLLDSWRIVKTLRHFQAVSGLSWNSFEFLYVSVGVNETSHCQRHVFRPHHGDPGEPQVKTKPIYGME